MLTFISFFRRWEMAVEITPRLWLRPHLERLPRGDYLWWCGPLHVAISKL